ncbi:hypothetical protein Tco_0471043 [Tanacetum coccineum]
MSIQWSFWIESAHWRNSITLGGFAKLASSDERSRRCVDRVTGGRVDECSYLADDREGVYYHSSGSGHSIVLIWKCMGIEEDRQFMRSHKEHWTSHEQSPLTCGSLFCGVGLDAETLNRELGEHSLHDWGMMREFLISESLLVAAEFGGWEMNGRTQDVTFGRGGIRATGDETLHYVVRTEKYSTVDQFRWRCELGGVVVVLGVVVVGNLFVDHIQDAWLENLEEMTVNSG